MVSATALGGVIGGKADEIVEAFSVGVDVFAVEEAVPEQDVGDAVQQCNVGAGLHRQMDVGHHRGLGDAWIGNDKRLSGAGAQTIAEDGMVVGDVGADEQNDVGGLHVGVSAGRPIRAEAQLVAGDGRSHAEGGVAVVVGGAKAELDEFAEGVELLSEELAGADYAKGLRSVLGLERGDLFDHDAEGLIPADRHERRAATSYAKERRGGAAGGVENVVF